MIGLRIFTRQLSVSLRRSNKFSFYDLVVDTPSHPEQPIEALLMKESELKELRKTSKTTFEGNYSLDNLSAEERISKVFGGRIKGEAPKPSSRFEVGEPKIIAGVEVPDKPIEPDNCCMSGCINCVWELYNDDIKDWNSKRKLAAEKLNKVGGRWPENFHAPIKILKDENLPLSLAGSPAKQKLLQDDGDNLDPWGNVPVSIRVFAETEKRLKSKRRAST